MPTRRQEAEEKRKAEEEAKRVEQDRRNKNLFKRRKLIGPRDIAVDPNLPKIYLGESAGLGEPGQIKVEVKLEIIVDEEHDVETGEAGNGEPEVFQGDEVIEEIEEIDQDTVEKVFPTILALLTKLDIFKCRLVNKQWRGIVDKILEDSVVPKLYDDEVYLQKLKTSPYTLYPVPKFHIVNYAYVFENETKLEKFNVAMKGHINSELSPFVGGATVTLKNLFKSSVLSLATKQLLEKFGVYICRLEIQQQDEHNDLDIVGFVNCVKECLHFVPNLEKLKIIGNSLVDQNKFTSSQVKLYRNEIMDRTPKLNKLESLEFEYSDPFKYHIQYKCLPYLEVIFGDIMTNPYYQSQLKQLSLDSTNKSVNFQANNVKELSLVKVECKLSEIKLLSPVEKLTLLNYIPVKEDDVACKFPNLRYLRLENASLQYYCFMAPNSTWHKNNVHTLEILDFVSSKISTKTYFFPYLETVFPHLRHLIVRNDFRTEGCDIVGMQLKRLIFGGTTYSTALWETFSKLEVFTFQFRNHVWYTSNSATASWCACALKKGTDECPLKNVVETRAGYQKYVGRNAQV